MSEKNALLATIATSIVVTLLSTCPVQAYVPDVSCAGSTSPECMADCKSNANAECNALVPGSTYCSSGSMFMCMQQSDGSWKGSGRFNCCKDGIIVADPHIRSLDGLLYDFQAVGEFVLLNRNLFALQVRQQSYGECAAIAVAAAAQIGANRIVVHARATPPLSVDGNPTRIPCAPDAEASATNVSGDCSCSGKLVLPDGSLVEVSTRDGNMLYTLSSPGTVDQVGINVRRAGYLDVSVTIGSEGGTSATGLLGSPDGDPNNDLRTRDGRLMSQPITFHQLYREFGDSWRVIQEESLFDYGPGESTDTFTDRDFPEAPCPLVQDDKRRAAEKACRSAGVTDEDMLRACIFDVNATGDKRFVDSYVGLSAPTAALTVLGDGTENDDGRPIGATFGRVSGGCDCNLSATSARRVWPCLVLGIAVLHRRGHLRTGRGRRASNGPE